MPGRRLQCIAGVELGGDYLRRDVGLGGVRRQQVRDADHGVLLAGRTAFRGFVGRRGKRAAKFGVDLAGNGVWDVGNRRHDAAAVLWRRKGGRYQSVSLTSIVYFINWPQMAWTSAHRRKGRP